MIIIICFKFYLPFERRNAIFLAFGQKIGPCLDLGNQPTDSDFPAKFLSYILKTILTEKTSKIPICPLDETGIQMSRIVIKDEHGLSPDSFEGKEPIVQAVSLHFENLDREFES